MQPLISSALQDSSAIHYPDSDGLPMANNTEHYKLIASTKHGLESTFQNRDDVFVAADLFWYPVEGKPKIVLAPDVMVAFGRPKGERSSYKQWEEGGIAPQVVFEFLSESNTQAEMTKKAMFFNTYGVQEYYLYDMERKILNGFIRFREHDDTMEEIPDMNNWISPRLSVRFTLEAGTLVLYKPDGTPFLHYDEYAELENLVIAERKKAEQERMRAEQERMRAEQEHMRAEQERMRAELLAAKLREMGIDADSL